LPTVVMAAYLAPRVGWAAKPGVVVHEVTEIAAAPLAHVALARLVAGLDFADAQPLYLRVPDVTLSSPKRVTG
jgi:tRNA threonylcarbamoyladenosine biosynthesis protein TsaB